jgi:glycosyltransferase involved in cell wall biosynthesis
VISGRAVNPFFSFMHMSKKFSLIVPTLNRVDEVRELFESLKLQTLKDFEVIVVDQNDDNRLESLLEDFSGSLDISHIRQSEKGASRARNAGLRKSTGNFVTFPDDDCQYPRDMLENVYQMFQTNSQLGGITVSTKDKSSEGTVARLSKTEGEITKLNIFSRTVEFTVFVRSSLIKNFYFDEDLGVGANTPWWSDEGPDFVLRLIEKGVVFRYFPNLLIYHPKPHKIFNEKAFIRSYKYGCGRGRFLKKHHYPVWFVFYVWGLYVAGIIVGCLQFDTGKIKYYFQGLKGRMEGYLHK